MIQARIPLEKKFGSAKFAYAAIGCLLGFGAPVGSLIIRGAVAEGAGADWLLAEWSANRFFYEYMTLMTPFIFLIFGYFMGTLKDENVKRNNELLRVNKVLKNRSMTDDLTGEFNHRHILEEVDKEIERAARHNRQLSGLMIDIDNFKHVNDENGHLAGDQLIKQTAAVLNQSIRKVDVVGRFGGDEFLILLPESTDETAHRVAERIQKNVRRHHFLFNGVQLSVTASIGISVYKNKRPTDRYRFIDEADQALLHAKRIGKDTIVQGAPREE